MSAPARARRLSADERRAQLVEVATRHFAARDAAAVSLDALAAEAGVTRNLLYRYFPAGRADLLAACAETACTRLEGLVETDAGIPLAVRQRDNLERWVELVAARDPALDLLRRLDDDGDPAVRARIALTRERVARAVAGNQLGDDPPAVAVAALAAHGRFVEELLVRARDGGVPTLEQVRAMVTATFDALVDELRVLEPPATPR